MHTILGINGATGPGLAAALRKKNIKVRGVSRRPLPGDWEHRQADVTNLAEVLDVASGSEVVYLLVGLEYNINVWRRDWPVIMENCIEACRANNAKFVFLDNVYSYGLVKGAMTEETPSDCSTFSKIMVCTAALPVPQIFTAPIATRAF